MPLSHFRIVMALLLACVALPQRSDAAEEMGAVATNAAAATQGATNATTMVHPDTFIISVGDRLSYRVVEDREDTKLIQVTPAGEIEVPYLGRVVVAGKSLTQAAREIKALLEKELYFQATVILSVEEVARKSTGHTGEPMRLKQIFVVGQVRVQGGQDIPPGEKYLLSHAIIKAGGLGSFANGRKVQIIRKTPDGKTKRVVADVLSVLKEGKLENDVELQPDDMIIVPEKLVNF